MQRLARIALGEAEYAKTRIDPITGAFSKRTSQLPAMATKHGEDSSSPADPGARVTSTASGPDDMLRSVRKLNEINSEMSARTPGNYISVKTCPGPNYPSFGIVWSRVRYNTSRKRLREI